MGTFQLGRVGLENTTGEVHGWSSGGSGIRVAGHTVWGDDSAAVAEALVVREQLLGYVEQADEDFVPVTWSEQPEVNGFYRVANVSVDSTPDRAPFGVLDWSVDLVRVQGFAAPLVENTVLGAPRANPDGVEVWNAVGLPAGIRSADIWHEYGHFPSVEDFTRVGESGSVLVHSNLSNAPVYSYYLPPEAFYEAAATLHVGDPLRVAVGRQIQNTVDAWSLGNDLIQIRPSFGSRFDLLVRTWLVATSAWSGWETLTFRIGFGGDEHDLVAPHAITVLRNSPEEVRIRLLASSARNPIQVDVALRRGARYASFTYNQLMGSASSFDVGHTATVTTGGYYWFGAGYGGFVASPVNINGLSGEFTPVDFPHDTWQFCFGLDETHSTEPDTITRSIGEYFWAASEKQSVVAQ